MNRILNLLLIPIVLFLAVGVVWFSVVLFLGSASFIADLLKGFIQSVFLELPKELLALLSDPWKVLALPFAVGVVIFFYQWLIGRLFDQDELPPFIRGRRLGDREQRPRRRSDPPRPSGRTSPRDRSDRL